MARAYLIGELNLTAARAAGLDQAAWLEQVDACARMLHEACMAAGATDRAAQVDSRAFVSPRYILSLPNGGLWECGGVSAQTGSVCSAFSPPEAGFDNGLPRPPVRWLGPNPLNGKWNHIPSPTDLAQGVAPICRWLSEVRA